MIICQLSDTSFMLMSVCFIAGLLHLCSSGVFTVAFDIIRSHLQTLKLVLNADRTK